MKSFEVACFGIQYFMEKSFRIFGLCYYSQKGRQF